MKKLRIAIIISLSLILTALKNLNAQVYSGNITLKTQAQVDSFGQLNYTKIDGYLDISGWSSNPYDITSLASLSSIKEVDGLSVQATEALQSLDGLLIEKILGGGIYFFGNGALSDVSSLSNLTYLSGSGGNALYSENNENLGEYAFASLDTIFGNIFFQQTHYHTVSGFNNVKHIEGWISFRYIYGIEEFDFFHNLKSISEYISFNECSELVKVNGFQNLESALGLNLLYGGDNLQYNDFTKLDTLGFLTIFYQDINNVNFLSNLKSVGSIRIMGCDRLTNLDGLSNVSEITGCSFTNCSDITITDNAFLGNCCSISHLIDGNPNNGEASTVDIQGNACACLDQATVVSTTICDYGNPLIDLYTSTNYALNGWTEKAGWQEINTSCDIDPCDGVGTLWDGVTCMGNKLTGLDLTSNNLDGSLLASIGDLTSLNDLLLGGNAIEGEIPPEIGNLDSLIRLSLGENEFSGSIPITIGDLDSLQFLYLQANELEGQIPTNIGNLGNLEQLLLYDNNLLSTIPTEFGNLKKLRVLNIQNNMLYGNIPSQLGTHPELAVLRLGNNNLTGTIPNSLVDLSQLTALGLGNNGLGGYIPSDIGQLNSLTFLTLGNNKLIGNLPSSLGDLTNLTILNGLGNNFEGCFHPNLVNLCSISPDFSNNPGLPGGGNFANFCSNNYGSCTTWNCDGAYTTIDNIPLPNGLLKMEQYIISGGTVKAPNLTVTFQAKDSIVLQPNFEVEPGAIFEVVLDNCGN